MFFHLVVLTKFSGEGIGYHFSSEDTQAIISEKDSVRNYSSLSSASCSVHVLKTSRSDFESIQEMDPYFENVHEYNDLEFFFDVLKSMRELEAENGVSEWWLDW